MKKIYLFCTKLRVYLLELPLLLLLAICYHYNDKMDNLFKLYPLMVFLVLLIIFIILYFFRYLSISFESIENHGLFSNRDRALINKDKQLILTVCKKHRMKVELFGEDEAFPDYDWIDKNAERAPFETYLFRGKAIAGKRKAKRILKFFFVDKNDLNLFFSEEGHQAEYEYVSVSGKKNDEGFVITIKMKETL